MGKKIAYSAAFLTDEVKNLLLKKFPPKHNKVFTHHSTIEARPTSIPFEIGEEVKLKVIGYAEDEKCQALLVENPYSNKENPHITLSCADGTAPVYSNELIKRAIENNSVKYFKNPFSIKAVLGYVKGGKTFIEKEETNTEQITKVCFFDFDGTLSDSPMPETGKVKYLEVTGNEYPHNGWWGRAESLNDDIFDIQLFEDIVKEVKNCNDDKNTHCWLMTARIIKLKPQIMRILSKYNIKLDGYSFKEDDREKPERIIDIMKKFYPNAKDITIYDDREKEFKLFDLMISKHSDEYNIEVKKVVDGKLIENKKKLSEGTHSEGAHYRQILYELCDDVMELKKMIDSGDELPSWIQDKITLSHHNIDAVLRYMKLNEGYYINEEDKKNTRKNYFKQLLMQDYNVNDLKDLSKEQIKDFFKKLKKK